MKRRRNRSREGEEHRIKTNGEERKRRKKGKCGAFIKQSD